MEAGPPASPLSRVRIVLVRPRSPGNVGSAARALMNFGLADLALVDLPTYDDPTFFATEAAKLAWKADSLLAAATRHPTLEAAVSRCGLVLGTTHRPLPGARLLEPRQAAAELVAAAAGGAAVALAFGGEANGLDNRELARCAGLVGIPSAPAYPELNLAQAVVVLAYELFRAAGGAPPPPPPTPGAEPAPFAEVEALFGELRQVLAASGYSRPGREAPWDELRRLLARAGLTAREANLLRGIGRKLRRGLGSGPDPDPAAGPP